MARQGRPARPAEEKGKVTLTLGVETRWRLRTMAAMAGVAPGQLVEGWIAPHLRAVRLPYEAYRSRIAQDGPAAPGGRTDGDDGADRVAGPGGAAPGDPGDGAGDDAPVLPIAEAVPPRGPRQGGDGPGQGRGDRKRTA